MDLRYGEPSRRAALLTVLGACATGCSTAPRAAAPATAATPAQRDVPSPSPAPRPTEVGRAASADRVALTFHGDGPPALAEALLSAAEHADARVTVLAVGRWLDQYPAMARRVLDGGHELGNHTEHHIDISALSPDAAYAEVAECADRLVTLTGSRGRWFRPSQAQHATPAVRAAAARAGYPTVLSYDVDSLDYTDPGPAAVTRNVLARITGGDVVSLHLGHPGTVTALPAILDGLHRRGLRPVTAGELFPAGAAE